MTEIPVWTRKLQIETAKSRYTTARADRIAHWPCQMMVMTSTTELEAKAGRNAGRDGEGSRKSSAFSPFGLVNIRAIRNKPGPIAMLTGCPPDSSVDSCPFLS